MFKINPVLAIDSYKLGHMSMYPEGTTKVYCNFTARSFKHARGLFPDELPFFNNKAVVFGISAAFQEINEAFQENFFNRDINDVLKEFDTATRPFIGDNDNTQLLKNIENLHKLGYLPLQVKSLPEGSQVKENIPMMTITNTHPDFAWLPNYLETFISSQIWKLSTAATIAKVYKNIFDYFADKTGTPRDFTLFQGHDFSSRGMSGFADAARTGSAHLTSFIGTDSVASVEYVKKYYKASGLIGASVPASEHSVLCMGGKDTEIETFRRILKKYPNGVVSIVSDTWDYWNTITNIAKELKEEILARGKDSLGLCKTVFRPDSGDPVDVICGTKKYKIGSIDGHITTDNMPENWLRFVSPEEKGSIHCLYNIFGGTKTSTGHIQLDEHVGLIYGDSITPNRAYSILKKLDEKGFASGNVVLGIGSYTYQFMTRDTLGFAMKATYGEINGVPTPIFKEPKTDAGKKSAKGLLRVDKIGGEYVLVENLTSDEGGELKVIFKDGNFENLPAFDEIRERLANA
jgi:nicotinamide phosphoribosyltransferase